MLTPAPPAAQGSAYVVTSRRKVHRYDCASARRIAFPNSWSPDVRCPEDHACITCLWGLLPTKPATTADLTRTQSDTTRGEQ